ncbi:MAG TPA: response regulator [Chloroflexota bacterium]|nr:response regulator [Chloroflexota bacterium]
MNQSVSGKRRDEHADIAEGSSGGLGSALPRVLLAEDDAGLRQTIEWTLQDEGILVETAPDGEAALDRLRQFRPALLLLDMGLPRVDGDGVAAGLRSLHGDAVPIVVLTADGHVQEKARRIGAVAYLKKPFDIDDLIETVRRIIPTP